MLRAVGSSGSASVLSCGEVLNLSTWPQGHSAVQLIVLPWLTQLVDLTAVLLFVLAASRRLFQLLHIL